MLSLWQARTHKKFQYKVFEGNKYRKRLGFNLAVVVVIDVYIVCDDGSINLTCWVVDFNALRHVTLLRDVFSSYTSG